MELSISVNLRYFTQSSYQKDILCETIGLMGFFLIVAEFAEFSEFRESTEAWIRINLTVFSVSCLCGAVVESLSLIQKIVGSSPAIFLK